VAVALVYLGESPVDRHELAVRAGGHVAVDQHAGKRVWRRLEFEAQDVGKSAFFDFDDGAGVMCNQSAQHGVGVLGVAQVAGTVECVQACDGQAGCVADVVQPRGGLQEPGVRAGKRCQAACPCGDALEVRPAAGEGLLQECPGELFGPWNQRVQAAKARQPRRDVHGRGMPSEDVLLSVRPCHPAVVLASARWTWRHQQFCGVSVCRLGGNGPDRHLWPDLAQTASSSEARSEGRSPWGKNAAVHIRSPRPWRWR